MHHGTIGNPQQATQATMSCGSLQESNMASWHHGIMALEHHGDEIRGFTG